MSKDTNKNEPLELLKENKNLILTGAPGTGKTYLAKELACRLILDKSEGDLTDEDKAKMDSEYKDRIGFVQFHPSYDYTDFVEGLRPMQDKNGNIGFERKDGVFKTFCKKAADFDTKYQKFVEDLKEKESKGEPPLKLSTKKPSDFSVTVKPKTEQGDETCLAKTLTEGTITEQSITKEQLEKCIYDPKSLTVTGLLTYLFPVAEYFKKNYLDILDIPPCVFIIDEINRGEISKIFGELFFSIDPSYRGKDGQVKTQYHNLIVNKEGELIDKELGADYPFKDSFYVPENVYIIGTMNDIDRSVESFDFAMRRRFVWREITADESATNMKLPVEHKNRMIALNQKIETIQGLNASYHIGAAYFLAAYFLKDGKPIANTPEAFADLWKLRLAPLLKEYLRGMPKEQELLKDLEKAYRLEKKDDGKTGNLSPQDPQNPQQENSDADTNNG